MKQITACKESEYGAFSGQCFLTFRLHCIKSVRIQSYSGPYFPAFGRNTESYGVSLRIQSECRKIGTRTTLNKDTFQVVPIRKIHSVNLLIHWENTRQTQGSENTRKKKDLNVFHPLNGNIKFAFE